MDNTRDKLLDLIRNATNIDMICFFAIIYVVAPDSPDYYSGFCAAVVKKLFGSTTHAKKVLGDSIQIND